jgi:hypothetical protein
MTPITVNMTSLTGAVNSLIDKKRNNLLPKKTIDGKRLME